MPDSHFCYWHDPTVSKDSPDIVSKLEQWYEAGHSLEGVQLSRAVLDNIRLNPRTGEDKINLKHVNFYRASLKGAHFFGVDLSGSVLMKANLSGANLNQSNCQNTNLLGCILDGAKIERIEWGQSVLQEQAGNQEWSSGNKAEALKYFLEAEEVYRDLRKNHESRGIFQKAGVFFRKEMIMKRLQMPLYSKERFISKTVDVLSGYGERPDRVVFFSISMIVISAIIYFFGGLSGANGNIQFQTQLSFSENLLNFFNSLYFSVVTFTTLGYGDVTPMGLMRFFASLEAFIGSFSMALFVVVFVKKMTR